MDGFLSGYAEMIRLCRERGARPVMMSLPPLVADRFYCHVTRELDPAGKENVLRWMSGRTDFISNWHERYNLAVFSLGRTPFLLRPDYFDFICRDGIHPNEKGHEIMAERLREAECLA